MMRLGCAGPVHDRVSVLEVTTGRKAGAAIVYDNPSDIGRLFSTGCPSPTERLGPGHELRAADNGELYIARFLNYHHSDQSSNVSEELTRHARYEIGFFGSMRRLEAIEKDTPVTEGTLLTAEEFGQSLLTRGLITSFQLQALLRGKGDRLRIGPYLLLDCLGRGGMGEVFRARHVHLGREVALKIIRQDKLESPTIANRFLRELQSTAKVEHPNVVRVFNAGRDSRNFYFSMEFVRGENLADLVKNAVPLTIAEACRAVGDAALGLQAIAEAGLVHRDIKPANLMRESAGQRTKVLDLGLAGLTMRQIDDSGTATLTQNGAVLGTPDYMAPEQALNPHSADHRSDLYSLGSTLVFLLTGRPPFSGGTSFEKLFHHTFTPAPDVRSARADIPAELAGIVARLLAKSPGDRFQSAAAVAEALGSFAHLTSTGTVGPTYIGEEFVTVDDQFAFDPPVTEPARPAELIEPPDPRLRKRWPMFAAIGAFAFLAIGAVYSFWTNPKIATLPPVVESTSVATKATNP